MSEWKTIVGIPDTQIPCHDRALTAEVIRFISDFQPDTAIHVGDFLDQPEPSRWNKGLAGEYEETLQAGIDEGIAFLEDLREVYEGPFRLKTGNHDIRVENYVYKYAPALRSLRALSFEDLIEADEYDVQVERKPFDFAPGWVCAHGDEGSGGQIAGSTAGGLARRFGKSVMCGHTHKAALKPAPNQPEGYNGKPTPTLWGMEIGNLMDMKKADYLKTGAANWQAALGLFYVKGNTVIPNLVPIVNGTFVVEGVVYGKGAA